MSECQHENRACIDSRAEGLGRRRRYMCSDCGKRYSTVEIVVEMDKSVPRLEQALVSILSSFGFEADSVKNMAGYIAKEAKAGRF